MSGRFGDKLATALLIGVSLAALPGCERSASGLTEWTPADHDHQVEAKKRHATATVAPANPHAPPTQKNQVIDVTWQKQCATCHGKRGRGDGPTSPMVKARDLSNPEWQAAVDDAELAKVIKEGKDKMPAFNLPDSVIQGLVAHVRSLTRKPKQRGGPAQPPSDDDADESASGAQAPVEPPAPGAPAPAGSASAPAAPATGKNVPAAAAVPGAPPAHGSARTDTAPQLPTAAPAAPPTAAPAPKP